MDNDNNDDVPTGRPNPPKPLLSRRQMIGGTAAIALAGGVKWWINASHDAACSAALEEFKRDAEKLTGATFYLNNTLNYLNAGLIVPGNLADGDASFKDGVLVMPVHDAGSSSKPARILAEVGRPSSLKDPLEKLRTIPQAVFEPPKGERVILRVPGDGMTLGADNKGYVITTENGKKVSLHSEGGVVVYTPSGYAPENVFTIRFDADHFPDKKLLSKIQIDKKNVVLDFTAFKPAQLEKIRLPNAPQFMIAALRPDVTCTIRMSAKQLSLLGAETDAELLKNISDSFLQYRPERQITFGKYSNLPLTVVLEIAGAKIEPLTLRAKDIRPEKGLAGEINEWLDKHQNRLKEGARSDSGKSDDTDPSVDGGKRKFERPQSPHNQGHSK